MKERLRKKEKIKNRIENFQITTMELQQANICWIKMTQNIYRIEIRTLKDGSHVDRKSKLLPLNPKLDKDGILRVGGRLCSSISLTEMEKYPIILPPKHRFTELLIEDAHIRNLHGGIQSTLALLRRKYWVINGRNEIKTFIRNCVICKKQSPKTHTQLMGNLPKHRIEQTLPFTPTGVDYDYQSITLRQHS